MPQHTPGKSLCHVLLWTWGPARPAASRTSTRGSRGGPGPCLGSIPGAIQEQFNSGSVGPLQHQLDNPRVTPRLSGKLCCLLSSSPWPCLAPQPSSGPRCARCCTALAAKGLQSKQARGGAEGNELLSFPCEGSDQRDAARCPGSF